MNDYRGGWTQGWVDPADREPCIPCGGTGLYFFAARQFTDALEQNREAIERVQSGEARWKATELRCGACHGEGYWRKRRESLTQDIRRAS